MRSLRWFGHSTFLITSDQGLRILTDPFGKDVPYPGIDVTADIVTVSHQHFDHNAAEVVKGNPVVLEGVARKGADFVKVDRTLKDTHFRTVKTFHDPERGVKRGLNAVFVMADASTTVCHLGDLGHVVDEETAREIGPVDILLIPVGGYYTIGASEGWEVVDRLKPRVVIPMHYKTPAIATWPIASVEEFLKGKDRVRRVGGSELSLGEGNLPESTEVFVLEPPARS